MSSHAAFGGEPFDRGRAEETVNFGDVLDDISGVFGLGDGTAVAEKQGVGIT